MDKKSKLMKIFDKIGDVLFPPQYSCISCDCEMTPNRYGLCEQCLEKLPLNDGRTCLKCGKPINNEADYCLTCMNNVRHFDCVFSPLIYDGLSIRIISLFKFSGRAYYARFLAEFMVDCYNFQGLDCDVITFVPMTKKAIRKRGFNQAELLAEYMANTINIELSRDIIKVRETSVQHTLSGKQRAENILGAYRAKNKSSFKGKNVLLIDDILTTGATVSEISNVIKKCGALTVNVITLANTPNKILAEVKK